MSHGKGNRAVDAAIDNFITLDGLVLLWMSAAESQICSLEVLCAQMPKVNALLEENMTVLDQSFSALASHNQTQSNNIDNMLETATVLQVDEQPTSLSEALSLLKESDKGSSVADRVDVLIAAVEAQHEQLQAIKEQTTVTSQAMVAAVSQAIVGMQFQDRLSQNLVIAEKVAKENVVHLQQNIDMTLEQKGVADEALNERGRAKIDIPFAKRLVAMLTLGELQHQFVDHLIAHGFIESGEMLGVADRISEDEPLEVELF